MSHFPPLPTCSFKSLQKRALIEPRRKIEQKKQGKRVEYVHVSHFGFAILVYCPFLLRKQRGMHMGYVRMSLAISWRGSCLHCMNPWLCGPPAATSVAGRPARHTLRLSATHCRSPANAQPTCAEAVAHSPSL